MKPGYLCTECAVDLAIDNDPNTQINTEMLGPQNNFLFCLGDF